MQSNNERCVPNQKKKARLRKVKKHTRKNRQFPVSHLDLDLETPNSVLVHADLKLLVNQQTFATLSLDRRAQLLRMLPECDQVSGPDKEIRLAEALNNEFFAKSCTDWKRKLAEGKFTQESQVLAKMEHEREHSRIDPWKLKHYEPFWGHKDPLRRVPSIDKEWDQPPVKSVCCDFEDTENVHLSTNSACTLSQESPVMSSYQLLPSFDSSQGLSEMLRLTAATPLLSTSGCSPIASPSSTSTLFSHPSVVAYSSQSVAVASTVLPIPRLGNIYSCSLDRFISNGSSLSLPRFSCSSSATSCASGTLTGSFASPASVSQTSLSHTAVSHPPPAVVFLTMPFLNRGTCAAVSNFPSPSTTSSLQTADKVVEPSNVPVLPPAVLPAAVLPPTFQLRFSLAANLSQTVTLTDGMRKRTLDCASYSDLQQPDCKRALITPPVLCQPGMPSISKTFGENIGLPRGVASQLAARLVPISNAVINGHQPGSVSFPSLAPMLSQAASSTTPAPTRLFSIPIQGMPRQTNCPVVFMLPQAGPRNGTALTQSTTASKFVYLISPPCPLPSTTANLISAGVSSKCEPQLVSNTTFPGLNGSRFQGTTNPRLPVSPVTMPLNGVFNGINIVRSSSHLLAAPNTPGRLYGVSLPSTAPVVSQLCGKRTMVSNPTWPVRLPNTIDVRTLQPISIPSPSSAVLRFASKGDEVSSLPSIRFIPNISVTSSPVPLFVEQLIASSKSARTTLASTLESAVMSSSFYASTVRSTPFHPGVHMPVDNTRSGPLSAVTMLSSFPSQMSTVLQSNVGNPGSGILRTLLSRHTVPSSIQSTADSITRSLSHLYAINASNCSNINSLAVRLLNSGGKQTTVDRTRLLQPVTVPQSDANKCGKCGAPCILLNGSGQPRLCITCLIMA